MKYFLLTLTLMMASQSYSQTASETGKISRMLVHNAPAQSSDMDKRVLIWLDGAMSGGFCSEKNWTIYLNNEAANAQYSLLLAAYMAGKTVKLSGNPSQICAGSQEVVRNIEFP